MKRLALLVCLVVAGTAGALGASPVAALASNGGNSDAALMCQQGGYANLIGTDGTTDVTFTNAGQCVSFAAHGGMLVQSSEVAACLNGGYARLMEQGGTAPFTSEAACVAYVLSGGTPVPVTGTGFVLQSPATFTTAQAQCWGAAPGVTPVLPALWSSGTYMAPNSTLCWQSDGNLVIYASTGQAVWVSNTAGTGATLAFQSDGNLVIYAADGTPLWSTGTNGYSGDCVVFQGDGNLVIYTSCTIP